MLRYLLLFLIPVILYAQPEATIHQEYCYALPKPLRTWTPVAGLPPGLILIPESGELWGAPNAAGIYNFALKASDGTVVTLNLKVNAMWNLSLTPPQAAVGVAFMHRQAIGGGTPPYRFTASGLPPGLSISGDGVISGTPTVPGSYSATIVVTDRQGITLTLAYGLKVNTLGIATTSLPYAEADKPYSQQLKAAGGSPPYRWSLLKPEACSDIGQWPVMPEGNRPRVVVAYNGPGEPAPPGDLTPDGVLTMPTPLPFDETLCVQVTDFVGNQARLPLTVVSLAPGDIAIQAELDWPVGEVSIGDPVFYRFHAYNGTSPYTATAVSLPSGFVFYPEQGFVFGYPQTPGIYSVGIQVKDGTGAIAVAESTFRASSIRVTERSQGNPTYGKPYSQQFYAVNATIPYSWNVQPSQDYEQLPAGLSLSPTGLLSGTPLEAGHFYPEARVTDSFGNSRGIELYLNIPVGTAGTIEVNGYGTPYLTLNRESKYVLSANGNPPYQWAVTGALPPGVIEEKTANNTLTFWGVPSTAGSYPVTLRVTDADGDVGIRIVTLRVTPVHGDVGFLYLVSGVMNQLQLSAAGGTPLYRWSVASGSSLPAGLTLSSSGLLSGTPAARGYFVFTATVIDAAGNRVDVLLSMTATDIRILTPQFLPPITVGQPFSLQLEALSSAGGYQWTVVPPDCLPPGFSLSPGGLLSGTATSVATVSCGISVTDAQGHSDGHDLFVYVVAPGQLPPRISGPLSASVSVGSFLSKSFSVSAAWPYTIAAAPGHELPPGLQIAPSPDGSFAVLSGYPTKAGAYYFPVQVTDVSGNQASSRVYLIVSPVHIIPVIPQATYNQSYSYQFQTLEQSRTPSWSVAPADRLPAGLVLSANGLLSGIPAETGPFVFTVRAGDAVAKVTLVVDSGSPVTYGLSRPPIVIDPGQTIALQVGNGGKTTVVSGNLPPGLAISPTGQISGFATTAGIYSFTIRCDADRGFGVAVITIRVGLPVGETRTLPAATLGRPYTAQLHGGALAAGEALPPGLALSADGLLSGTPTAPWLYQFSALLTDSAGGSVISTYTLEVLSAPDN